MASIAQQLFFRRKPAEDERLLQLFWNRAELKREFARLQRDRDGLSDQLRQQEGATLRWQQRLEQLEGLLADPERAANAAVFFQLRGVWQYCRRRLARLARELATRQQEAELRRETARFEEHRKIALASIEQRLAPLIERRVSIEAELHDVRLQQAKYTRFWQFLARRRYGHAQAVLDAALAGVQSQIERYEKARHEKLRESVTPASEIDTGSKRLVNLSVIALAQELVVQLETHHVAQMARDASLRQVNDLRYGDLQACHQTGQQVARILRQLDELDDLPVLVRSRAEYLRRQVEYLRDADTVPIAASCADIPLLLTAGDNPVPANDRRLPVNVLGEEYWEIYSVLLN
ncbi:MAG: hypothetical protein KJ049_05370 [Gammaproteobacteria bacterium]|jgi:hypothetical protein|nr:hypothetical protein [Gammaproteobacteria bacterium]